MILEDYVTYVRNLTGIRMSDIVSDDLIKMFVNEAYVEVLASANWSFLERIDYLDLPASVHLVETDSGVVKVQEVVVRNADATIQIPAHPVPSNLRYSDVPENLATGSTVHYDVLQPNAIEIFPSFTQDMVVEVRYQQAPGQLAPGDSPIFRSDYHPMLAYRVASKVLTIQADETGRVGYYAQEFQGFLERMLAEYQLSHDEGTFQLFAEPGDGATLNQWRN